MTARKLTSRERFQKAQVGLLTFGMLFTGSLNTIITKIVFQTEGKNIDGTMEKFLKPWISTLIMFLAETSCIGFFYIKRCIERRSAYRSSLKASPIDQRQAKPSETIALRDAAANNALSAPLNDVSVMDAVPTKVAAPPAKDPTGGIGFLRFFYLAMMLSSFDLFGTTLVSISLMYSAASVTQILRGFVIVFTMIVARIFLKRKPTLYQIIGVLFAIIGLACVGASAVLAGEKLGDQKLVVVGILLAIFAQVFSAVQFVVEEKTLKGRDVDPLFLVGWEGVGGSILTACIALPICNAIPGDDHGSYESYPNDIFMLFTNGVIFGLNLVYFFSIATFNALSLTVSKLLTSTHRTLIDSLRVGTVWVTMVLIYYLTNHAFGEALTLYSILQLFGFLILVLGTLVHNNVGRMGQKMVCADRKRAPKKGAADRSVDALNAQSI